MTVEANTRRTLLTASGGQTAFNFTFEIADEADIVVYQNGTELTLTTHYTVGGVGGENGGTVTLVTGATADDSIVMMSEEVVERDADFNVSGDFFAATVNALEDKVVRLLQDITARLSGGLRLLDHDLTDRSGFTLPDKASRLGKLLRFNSSTGQPEMVDVVDLDGVAVSAFMGDLLDDESAAEAKTTLGITEVQAKYDATTAPTANDDSDDGYQIGSPWIDITNQIIYFAENVSVAAAEWLKVATQNIANVFTAAQTYQGALRLQGARANADVEAVTSSATPTFDFADGNRKRMVMGHNITGVTLSNPGSQDATFKIRLHRDGTLYSITGIPSAVKWPAVGAPDTTSLEDGGYLEITLEFDATDSIYVGSWFIVEA